MTSLSSAGVLSGKHCRTEDNRGICLTTTAAGGVHVLYVMCGSRGCLLVVREASLAYV